MPKFSGFTDRESFTRVPDSLFRTILPEVDDLDELKVTLYMLWRFEHMEGASRHLVPDDFKGVVADPTPALENAARRGSLLLPEWQGKLRVYPNSPWGRAVAQAYSQGKGLTSQRQGESLPPLERPNIFKLYEENIGPLTPLIAEALKAAEQEYPPEWLPEALEIAVKNNKRSWKYAEAILRRWKEEGHAKEQDRRDAKEHRGDEVRRNVEKFLKR
jgi:DNA replication protein